MPPTQVRDCGRWESSGYITDNMICACLPKRSACMGDSGGPLVTEVGGRHTLIGVVSWGPGECLDPDLPSVFARVTSVLRWIKSTASSGNTCYP